MKILHTAQIAVTLAVGFALGSTITASVHAQTGPAVPAPPPAAPAPAGIPAPGAPASGPWQPKLKTKEKLHYFDLLGITSNDDAKNLIVRNRPDAINVVDAGISGNIGALWVNGALQFGTGSSAANFQQQALNGDERIVADLGVALNKLMKPAEWAKFRADEQTGSQQPAALILGRAERLAGVAITLKSL